MMTWLWIGAATIVLGGMSVVMLLGSRGWWDRR